MSQNSNSSSNDQNSDSKKKLRNDFHPPVEDTRPVNIDGRPEEDFEDNDYSLFHTRPRRF